MKSNLCKITLKIAPFLLENIVVMPTNIGINPTNGLQACKNKYFLKSLVATSVFKHTFLLFQIQSTLTNKHWLIEFDLTSECK